MSHVTHHESCGCAEKRIAELEAEVRHEKRQVEAKNELLAQQAERVDAANREKAAAVVQANTFELAWAELKVENARLRQALRKIDEHTDREECSDPDSCKPGKDWTCARCYAAIIADKALKSSTSRQEFRVCKKHGWDGPGACEPCREEQAIDKMTVADIKRVPELKLDESVQVTHSCAHDWVIHPDTVDEDKHELCKRCMSWVPKATAQGGDK